VIFKSAYRWFISLILGIIFISQSYSLAHATRYNDAGHEHNGVACEITLASAEDVVIIPAPTTAPTVPLYADSLPHTVFISASYITPQGRAPPPRSPPTLF